MLFGRSVLKPPCSLMAPCWTLNPGIICLPARPDEAIIEVPLFVAFAAGGSQLISSE